MNLAVLYRSTFWSLSFVRLRFELASREAWERLSWRRKACHSQVPSHWRGAPPELVFNVSNRRGSFAAAKCEGVTASRASGRPDTGLCRVTGLFPCQQPGSGPGFLILIPQFVTWTPLQAHLYHCQGHQWLLVSLLCRPGLLRGMLAKSPC